MNYYQRHIGDTLKVAAHLSILEHGVYVRIADIYYAREGAIPECDVARLIMARTEDERAAVTTVLDEFFELVDGRYINAKFDADIAKFKAGEPDREAKRQNDRDRQERARAARAELFEKLRLCGKVPAFDIPMSELRRMVAQLEPRDVTKPVTPVTRDITTHVTRDDTATQYPIANHQPHTRIEDKRARERAAAMTCPDDVDQQVWKDWVALRKAKRAPVSDTTVQEARSEAGKAGITLEAFLRVWCGRGSQGLQAEWLKPQERQQPHPAGASKHTGFDTKNYRDGVTEDGRLA